jgi:hypothetical protein
VLILVISIDRRRKLIDEVLRGGIVRLGADLPDHRHQDGDQHPDDGHHHHQLREGKSTDLNPTATTNLLRHRVSSKSTGRSRARAYFFGELTVWISEIIGANSAITMKPTIRPRTRP